MIKHKISFLVVWAVHFLIAAGSLFIAFAWTMGILDDTNPQDVVPLGLHVVSQIAYIFTAPLFLFPGVSHLAGSFSFPFIFLTLLFNSFVICYLLVFIWEKFYQNKQH